jgi:hypothetical protein
MIWSKKRRALLALEELETRWVPATLHFVNGTLSITNLVSTGAPGLQIIQSPATANTFTVTDGAGASSLTFTGVSNILVDAGNAQRDVTFESSGKFYTGNLTINAHNGNDSITLNNTSTTTGGIQGNTLIITGTGTDTVAIGPNTSNNLNFGGNLTLANALGVVSVSLAGNENTTVGGNLTITSAATVAQGGGVLTVLGSTSIQDAALPSSKILLGAVFNTRNLYIAGGQGADSVTVLIAAVNGTTAISLGQGNDTCQIEGSLFNGPFRFTSGAGSDSVLVFGDAINGATSFNLGGGNDTLNLGTVGVFDVNGDLSIQEGSGNDSIAVGAGATLFGNLTMSLGNGNDTVVVNAPAAPTGLFSLNAGNGNSSISLAPGSATFFSIAFNFGTGTDTLTLGGTASSITGSLLSQNPGGNVFNQDAWTIIPPWTSTF